MGTKEHGTATHTKLGQARTLLHFLSVVILLLQPQWLQWIVWAMPRFRHYELYPTTIVNLLQYEYVDTPDVALHLLNILLCNMYGTGVLNGLVKFFQKFILMENDLMHEALPLAPDLHKSPLLYQMFGRLHIAHHVYVDKLSHMIFHHQSVINDALKQQT